MLDVHKHAGLAICVCLLRVARPDVGVLVVGIAAPEWLVLVVITVIRLTAGKRRTRVLLTAVHFRFVGISEEAHHSGRLVSFALTTDLLLEARQATVGGADNAIDSYEEAERTIVSC